MKKLHIHLKENSYDLLIERNSLPIFGKLIAEVHKPCHVVIVTDENVSKYYLDGVSTSLQNEGFSVAELVLPAGEKTKNLSNLPLLYDSFLEAGLSRTDLIVALGGGVIGDITGFAASSYLRGIPFIQIPTSLLAQVDSSVGGKVAVDLPQGKNLVGAFYHPKKVLIDPDMLDTLSDRFYRDGMAEVIKYGCIFDHHFFDQLVKKEIDQEEMIYTCCALKAKVVEEDERDKGARMLLNFGHTIGHAIEKAYHFETYTHGEAVGMGMVAITKLAEKQGLTEQGTADKIANALEIYGLPTELPIINQQEILEAISHDKKNLNRKLHAILLHKIGKSYVKEVDVDFFEGVGKA